MLSHMPRYFRTVFLDEVKQFLKRIDVQAKKKILYNIRLSEHSCDPRLFKKLTSNIWEFRTMYENQQYRLLAFWDKDTEVETLVIVSHGIIKKTDKVPAKEIDKAENVRKIYFRDQNYHQ